MKTRTAFRTYTVLAIAAATTLFYSCKQGENTQGAEEDATEQTADDTATMQDTKESDASFLAEATIINMEEIDLGKLAQTKAVSKDAKDFGTMMVDGHSKSLDELKGLAEQKGVSLPKDVSEKGKATKAELTKTNGKEFDKMYAAKMVDGHKEAIAKFEAARDNTTDADIKSWIEKTLPDLQMHLEHAQMVHDKMK